MPLSEYEQRVLEQMERALTSDDPRLANTLQSSGHRPVMRYVIAGIGLVVGLLVLVLGAANSNVWLGVVGFAVMFGAVGWAFAFAPRAKRGPEGVVGADGNVNARTSHPAKGAANGSGFMSRLEARWDRRREQGR
ncbi:hypothetical protein Xcel_1271 [Xylanimonas cellulosilytica DSM 15894]|uniref:Transmembrane protein n=1 Tax=Xylanimonas cellulosilytica (strain DSM 15894 / JCM 12276 / CECT 5975 / KCTC 9989 / LMG 20990 / NBRC 107835 / XIL07) TaxID=446471 RepID=D1C0B3_XYLCX|nr:DUF3040 domain-containing protein [Xylanimonas cellulosilytica]ACZ30302.1 hypothetical protein Xcel_1271 [Xylanimonas cellulosilytica DSM 15894]